MLVRARRIRVANGQQGRLRGVLLRLPNGGFRFQGYGLRWELPRLDSVVNQVALLARPGEQVPVEVTITWQPHPDGGGRHRWQLSARGKREKLDEGQLALFELTD